MYTMLGACLFCITIDGVYYMPLLHDKVQPILHWKHPELLEHSIIFLQDSATPHCHCDVWSLPQIWGWEVLAAHFPCSSCDWWLVCLFRWSSYFRGIDFSLQIHQEGSHGIITPSTDEPLLVCLTSGRSDYYVELGADVDMFWYTVSLNSLCLQHVLIT
jgi:hypothetical protein